MVRRGEITGRRPRATASRAKRSKIPNTSSLIVESDPDAIESIAYGELGPGGCTKAMPIRGPPVPPAVFTIASFCSAHFLSESMFHKMRETGIGPREMRVGSRVFVTFEAAAAWRAEREAATAAAAE